MEYIYKLALCYTPSFFGKSRNILYILCLVIGIGTMFSNNFTTLRKERIMRSIINFLMALILVGVLGCEKPIDIEAEKSAIIKVLDAESSAFFARDIDSWEKTWVQEPYTLKISSGKNNYFELLGWNSIQPAFKEGFEKSPEPMEVDLAKENFTFHIWKDVAWVIYEQHRKNMKEDDPDYVPYRVAHVLEKTNDGWKIVYMGTVYRNSYRESESGTSPN